jgi:hypothetical protein
MSTQARVHGMDGTLVDADAAIDWTKCPGVHPLSRRGLFPP